MKNIKISFLVICLSFFLKSFSQGKEYVILSEGDTLYGETTIPVFLGKPKFRKSIIYTGPHGKTEKFRAFEIKGHKESGIEYFSFNGNIMKSVITGRLILLDGRYPKNNFEGMSIGIPTTAGTYSGMILGGGTLTPPPKALLFYRRGSEPIYIKKMFFASRVSEYFRDYPALASKIKKKEYRYHDLVKIVEEYNNWFIPVQSNQEED